MNPGNPTRKRGRAQDFPRLRVGLPWRTVRQASPIHAINDPNLRFLRKFFRSRL